ncbi:MAG: hypothetical protein LBK52_06475 [Deltaproteobacteria bacterium]|nr:hypothetical protein [Deltaproteobacteria bacterium]
MSEIVLAGAGLVTAFGNLPATLEALRAGRRIEGRPVEIFSESGSAFFLAGPDPPAVLPDLPAFRKMQKYMSAQALLAAAAAREALEAARPLEKGFAPERIGLFAGTGLAAADPQAGAEILTASLDEKGCFSPALFSARGLSSVNPLRSFQTLANMPACIISVLEGIKGESAIYCPLEDGTARAVIEAVLALEAGRVDLALAAAADTPNRPSNLGELAQAGYLRPEETAAAAGGALVLARKGEGGYDGPVFRNFQLRRTAPGRPFDPLSARLGRTAAAAPIILAVLSALAPELALEKRIAGSQGHELSFEAAPR